MIRNTKQRQLIFELVQDIRGHPTADEIYIEARRSNAHISRGTVYRNLGNLVEEGHLRKFNLGKDPERYDSILEQHYHFVCRICRQLTDISYGSIGPIGLTSPDLPGYSVEGHTLLINGLCSDCAYLEHEGIQV